MRIFLSFLILQFALAIAATAQTDTAARRDSTRVYRMGEITVGGERERDIKTATVQQIPIARLQRSDASTAEQLAQQIPAGQIRTNSRGEALVFLRGVGERQVAVFLDGALLNVPWDNRIDLAMLPLNAIGAVTVTKGVPSILYGANVTGGAVSFISQEQPTDGSTTDVGLLFSQFGDYSNLSLTQLGASGAFNYVASIGAMRRAGIPLAEDAELPYGQTHERLRTNTDQNVFNGYARAEYKFSDLVTSGLSLNYVKMEKGAASEAHLPKNDARFWRYPRTQNFHLILNTEAHLTEDRLFTIRATAWKNDFSQFINQYTDSTYRSSNEHEEDHDDAHGARIVVRKEFGKHAIDISFNALGASHQQFGVKYRNADRIWVPTLKFKQNTYSTGLEYQTKLTDALKLIAGGTYDLMSTPLTGDKPSQGNFSDFSAMLGLGYAFNENLSARANAGRKTRFPTMRELYGEALGRFVLNPDLHAERTNIVEAGLTGTYDWGRFEIVGFNYITDGAIERIDTTIDDKTFRKRVNLEGSTNPGVELSALITELRPLTIEASFTYMHPRATKENIDGTRFLSERPEIISNLTFDYLYGGLQPTIEISHTKPGYSSVDNVFIELPSYTILNARLAYRFIVAGLSAQIFVRANNLTDAVPLNQIGLPGAGRELQGGVKLLF